MDSISVFLLCVICAAGLGALIVAFVACSLAASDYRPLSSADHSSPVPREFLNDEEALVSLLQEYDFLLLLPEEQLAYLKAEEFTINNPPNFHHQHGSSWEVREENDVKERGISAFEFDQDQDFLQPRFHVEGRTEVSFTANDSPYLCATAVLNYLLPVKNRTVSDTVYFEVKVLEIDTSASADPHFSIGLVTKPYPLHFRLPGYNSFSIGYELTGNLKINKPLPTPLQQHQEENSQYNALVLPPLQRLDVVGFGYLVTTGTIFVTHNGKKLMDIMRHCYVDLYPAVGCFLTNAKFLVNVGSFGYVWIEANVRKYAFVSTTDYKQLQGSRGLAALPQYATGSGGDKILDKGEELPPRYPVEELDFFGRALMEQGSSAQLMRGSDTEKEREKPTEEILDEDKDVRALSPRITDEPDEVMDLRERIYEQNTAVDDQTTSEQPSVHELKSTSISVPDETEESEENQKAHEEAILIPEVTQAVGEGSVPLTAPVVGTELPDVVSSDVTPAEGDSGAGGIVSPEPPSQEASSSEAPSQKGSSCEPSTRETTPLASSKKKNAKKKKKNGKKKGKKK